jgi:protein-disulfide isomerase
VEAAVRADCAGRQGKFKEYAGLLFEKQQEWAMMREPQAKFDEFADKAGLDKAVLAVCLADPETARQVSGDMAEGDMRGINATPTFFVNGKRAVGFGQLVDKARPLIISLK